LWWLQDVPAGSELLISYLGSQPSKDNTALMKDYGFILPGNINDSIAFTPAGEKSGYSSQRRLLPAW
jgi:hypothetical protein